MNDRQQVQDLAQLKELLAPPGERHAHTIDGRLIVTGADNVRYEVPLPLVAQLVEQLRRTRLELAELARILAAGAPPLEEKTDSDGAGEIGDPGATP